MTMRDDTKIGGAASFPVTRGSVIEAARSSQPDERRRALETLIAVYWKPVYKYIRLRWSKDNEEGKDLTQEFFARLLEKDFLGSYDAKRAKLRTFLRVCVDRLIANQEKADRRLKRGGDLQFLPLEFETADGELKQIGHPAPAQMEDFFDREWARSVFGLSVERLRKESEKNGKQTHFRLLELYEVEDGGRQLTYEQVAQRFGLKTSDVTNYLAYARREFRRTVLEVLRTMTASEEEFQREVRSLLGTKVVVKECP
jgi:RNA polymerase sigma factor (sigma-70 family)